MTFKNWTAGFDIENFGKLVKKIFLAVSWFSCADISKDSMSDRRRYCRVLSSTIVVAGIVTAFLIFKTSFDWNWSDYHSKYLLDQKQSPLRSASPFVPYEDPHYLHLSNEESSRPKNAVEGGNLSYDQLKTGNFEQFNVDGSDVIVFLHIQKTGGTTFEQYLVKQLDVPRPCLCKPGKKKCQCRRPSGRGVWLFSRFSTGWSCGLHADWTELVVSGCVEGVLARREHRENVKNGVQGAPKQARRYFLTTFIREPIARYLSEFHHIQRGATWSASKHLCNNRIPSSVELPSCFDSQLGWNDVTFDEFTQCTSNLANNRESRMLADLTLVGCYNLSYMPVDQRNRLILKSAKENLLKMAFFGLQDDMRRSQYIFERTFNLQFNKPLVNWNETTDVSELSADQLERAKSLNSLDLEFYSFAKQLFYQRFEDLKKSDPLYDVNIAS